MVSYLKQIFNGRSYDFFHWQTVNWWLKLLMINVYIGVRIWYLKKPTTTWMSPYQKLSQVDKRFCFVCACSNTHTQTCLTAPFPGLPRWANTRKVKPIWILLMAVASAGTNACLHLSPEQITTPTPHHSVLYRPDALPAIQPTYWRKYSIRIIIAFGHSTPGVQRSSCLVEFWFKWPSSSFY